MDFYGTLALPPAEKVLNPNPGYLKLLDNLANRDNGMMPRELPEFRVYVDNLITTIRSKLPVNGHTNHTVGGFTVSLSEGWPKSYRAGVKQMRWILNRSTDEGSADEILWCAMETHLAMLERYIKVLNNIELDCDVNLRRFRSSFERLLRHELFSTRFETHPEGNRHTLHIDFVLIEDSILVKLQRAAYAVGLPAAKRKAL